MNRMVQAARHMPLELRPNSRKDLRIQKYTSTGPIKKKPPLK